MNIKRAKQEIKDCIEAYLLKDERGEYVIPPVRQRPLFLIGPPGIGKTQIMESAESAWYPIPSPTTQGRAPSAFPSSRRRTMEAGNIRPQSTP